MSRLYTQRGRFTSAIKEFFVTIATAMILVLVVRSILFESFHIPSKSMMPTLLVGDCLFVSKFSYGYSRYSFPFGIPAFEGRFFTTLPNRGDVVVFKLPTDNQTDYIKRVIGLPGDHIQVIHRVVYINGEPVGRRQIEDYVESDGHGNIQHFDQFIETLPNGVEHPVLEQQGLETIADNTPQYIVPAHHYFMMGDNRDNSRDSRFLGAVGYVPVENLVGRATLRYLSVDTTKYPIWAFWAWPLTSRWDRSMTRIN
jgi:signal peptidase I